jgi:uncharacterized protein (DUF1778 family)
MVKGERSERVALRLTPEEAQVVTEVSDETGLSVSDVMRQALRRAYAEKFAAAKPKGKPKR